MIKCEELVEVSCAEDVGAEKVSRLKQRSLAVSEVTGNQEKYPPLPRCSQAKCCSLVISHTLLAFANSELVGIGSSFDLPSH